MIDSPSDCPFSTSPLSSTLVTVQLIIIDLLHFLFIVLEVLVIVLTLCVHALLIAVVFRTLLVNPFDLLLRVVSQFITLGQSYRPDFGSLSSVLLLFRKLGL